ncbi:MAG: hypothetical protein H0T39_02320 [Actinobacteria bacterium]|nr:hypothetical protein [Actinomycetota bacterium]
MTKALPDAGHDRGSSSQRGAHTETWRYREERLTVKTRRVRAITICRIVTIAQGVPLCYPLAS